MSVDATRGRRGVVNRLGQRTGMRDLTYFVGRVVERTALGWLPDGQTSRAWWIHGPRRIGKSSLARALCADAAIENAVVVWTDLSSVGSDFESAMANVLREAARAGVSAPTSRSASAGLESIAKRHGRPPLLFVFDECDQLAVSMSTDEQAILRRLLETTGDLGFLFVSRMSPTLTVEEVADVRSRLLGVTQVRSLGALSQAELHDLFGRVGKDVDAVQSVLGMLGSVWDRVGGLPLCATALLQEIVCNLDSSDRMADIDEFLESCRPSLEHDLVSMWRELRPRTRVALLDEGAALEKAHQEDARADGFFTKQGAQSFIRPRWLVETGRRVASPDTVAPWSGVEGESSDALALCAILHECVFQVNRSARMRWGGEPWFEISDEWLRYYHVARSVTDCQSFASAVHHLYSALYEAGLKSSPGGEWRMPEEFRSSYVGSVGILALAYLRRFCNGQRRGAHEPGDVQHAGEQFQRLVGLERPNTPEAWSAARLALLRELEQSLRGLADAVEQTLTRRQ